MKFVSFVLRNTFRNRRRTVLTVLSIGMSLFLICTLRTLLEALENPPATPESARRVLTRHATGLANNMPVAYKERILKVPGVEFAVSNQWFGGEYIDPANFFARFAVDADHFFDVYPDYQVESPEQRETFLKNRTASLAGKRLAKRFDWKVGQTITLKGDIFPVDVETRIAGFLEGGNSDDSFYFHWDYLNELIPKEMADRPGTFVIRAGSSDDVPAIVDSVDSMFQNSAAPTKTETEGAFILGFVSMMGNVRFLITSISTVVLFTVVLVAANTMAMSIRERTGEIAILKTLGFTPGLILTMTIVESALIAVTGGLLGALAGRYLYRGLDMGAVTQGFVPFLDVRWETVGFAGAVSLAVAVISTFFPALNVSRMPIAVALRRRAQ
ncbi:MAG TPA: FtsX-like permease family protein [Terriglobia bacterium]|nr:FtsX-like permease family protein [Terriglobia bacterium]